MYQIMLYCNFAHDYRSSVYEVDYSVALKVPLYVAAKAHRHLYRFLHRSDVEQFGS